MLPRRPVGRTIRRRGEDPTVEEEEEEGLRVHLLLWRRRRRAVRQRRYGSRMREGGAEGSGRDGGGGEADGGLDDGAAGSRDHDPRAQLLGLLEPLPPLDDELVHAEGRE